METVDDLKKLKCRDWVMLYFPYSGNYVDAQVIGQITEFVPGIHVQYVNKSTGKVDTYDLYYEDYKDDASDYSYWIAYKLT